MTPWPRRRWYSPEGTGRAVEVSLPDGTTAPAQKLSLFFGLDSFGDSIVIQRRRHSEDGLDDRRRRAGGVEATHEGLIDLQNFERQAR
ncbi:MAG: hypothetical protein WDN76_04335 [Alphaproteobacteria bacterium]